MRLINKIYTILVLLFNLVVRRKHYHLHFVAENDPPLKRWYYDFPHWGFDHANLEMVSGAEKLCEFYSYGKDEVTVDIIASNKDLGNLTTYDHYVGGTLEGQFLGRIYHSNKPTYIFDTFWICPVTLFVLGRYPNHIYIKHEA